MAILSDEQRRFLTKHFIPLSQVFDASGMGRASYQAAMRDLNMLVAIGVPPCTNGHTLKTRSGHCPQCKTHNIAFIRRQDEDGYVYVAGSKQGKCIKIGTAADVCARITSLNYFQYGGVSDWKLYYHTTCAKAGKVEFHAQSLLAKHRTQRSYLKTGKTVDCHELFDCPASDAAAAVQTALSGLAPKSHPVTSTNKKTTKGDSDEAQKQPTQKIPIRIKGPVYIPQLAQMMGIKAHHVVQDLLKMKIFLRLDQEVTRQAAEKVCKKRGFALTC